MSKGRFISRRDFLFEAGTGISGLALLALLEQDGLLAQSPSDKPAACANRYPGDRAYNPGVHIRPVA